MAENNTNALDQMDDENSQDNGVSTQSGAPSESDAAGNNAAPAAPQAPAAPAPAAPAAGDQSAANQENAAPVPPQHVPSRAVVSHTSDHGIVYGKRKAEMAEILKKQPKVAFLIPRVEGEDANLAYETVQINGHRMEIRKGVMVNIPQQVAEILANKYQVQMEAGADKRVDRDESVMDHLSK